MSTLVSASLSGEPDDQPVFLVRSWISACVAVPDSNSEATTTSPGDTAPGSTNPPAGEEKLNAYAVPLSVHCAVANVYASKLSMYTPMKAAAPSLSWAAVQVSLGMVKVTLALANPP